MQCVCCRCGAIESNGDPTDCLAVAGCTDNQFYKHCFCSAQPPRMKCLYCGVWRDLSLVEAHGPCHGDNLHVFLYSEPWPPFPEYMSRDDASLQLNATASTQMHTSIKQNSTSEIEEIAIVEDSSDNDSDNGVRDIKPEMKAFSHRWVTLREIQQWTHCIRCGVERSKNAGWVRHARQCAQDPKFATKMFFIRLHTKAWCGLLIMDSYWDNHTNPERGSCEICRVSRRNQKPLPFQPKPPPRPNEDVLEKRRRKKRIFNKKRRQTLAEDTIN